MTTCKNCGRQTETRFCPDCGQSTAVKRLEMATIVRDLPSIVLNVDRGFLYNVVQLVTRPGYAIKDYLDGRRKPFQHPLTFMLIILGAMLVAMNLMEVHYYDPVQDAWMSPQQAAFWRDYDATQQNWIHYYKFYIPFYLPWMALVYCLWLRLMGQRYTYAEGVCISFFNSAQMTAPQIVVLVLAYLVGRTSFARISDWAINWPIMCALWAAQFYQLANPALARTRRWMHALGGSALLFAFSYAMIYLFLAFMRRLGA